MDFPIKKKDPSVTKTFKAMNKNLFYSLVETEIENLEMRNKDLQIEQLTNVIKNAKEASTKISMKKIKLSSAPWISYAILQEIKQRENYFKKMKKDVNSTNQQGINWNFLYNESRKKVKNMIESAKQQHFNDAIKNAGSDSRKIWKAINNELGKTKSKNNRISKIVTKEGNELVHPMQIANYMNDFFTNINRSTNYTENRIPNRKCNQSMFLTPTSENELTTDIAEMRNDAAPGYDLITPKDLKIISPIVVQVQKSTII